MGETTSLAGGFRAFKAFSSREFRLVWSAQAVSLVGDAAFVTALGWRTFTLAGSGKLGIVLVCQSLAVLTTVLLGGALADRLPRRTLMIASDLARFVAVGALAAVDASGHLTFPLLLVLATLMGLGDGFFYPAFGGIVPLLVEPSAVPSANAMIGVARWSSLLLGPSLAAFVYGGAGSATVFALDAATFLFSAALLWATKPRPVERSAAEGTIREIWTGVRYVCADPLALGDDRRLRARPDAAVRTAAGADAEARLRALPPRRRRVRPARLPRRARHDHRHRRLRTAAAAAQAGGALVRDLAGQQPLHRRPRAVAVVSSWPACSP